LRKLATYSVAAGAGVGGESLSTAAPVYVDIPDVTLDAPVNGNDFAEFDVDGNGSVDIIFSQRVAVRTAQRPTVRSFMRL